MADARGKCVTDLLTGFAFKQLPDYSIVPDPLSVPSAAAMLKKNTMGSAAPAAPVFNYHANTDEIVPVGQANALVNDVVAFLSDRFAGKPAATAC